METPMTVTNFAEKHGYDIRAPATFANLPDEKIMAGISPGQIYMIPAASDLADAIVAVSSMSGSELEFENGIMMSCAEFVTVMKSGDIAFYALDEAAAEQRTAADKSSMLYPEQINVYDEEFNPNFNANAAWNLNNNLLQGYYDYVVASNDSCAVPPNVVRCSMANHVWLATKGENFFVSHKKQ